jgi:DnaJ-like protein
MMAVPRRSQPAADQEADTHVNGTIDPAADAMPPVSDAAHDGETTRLPVLAEESALATPLPTVVRPDAGLYAVLGLDPSASEAQIQTAYRRQAARLIGGDNQALKQLNVAYEVLGNSARRAEYDRMRLTQALVPAGAPTPIRPGAKVAARSTKRRRPRQAVQPRYPGMGDVFVVLMVVGFAVAVGFLLIPRLSVNLSALNALQAVLPLSNNSTRRVIDATATAVPSPEATATPLPSVSARYASSSVTVSNPTPAQNSAETVQIRLRRDGAPMANSDVWATVQYRTTEERWPATGTVKTDASGAASITFNIGAATPNYPVTVHVFTQAEDQQLSWATTFTPH